MPLLIRIIFAFQKFQNTCKKSEMSSFSSGLKLSIKIGSSNEALCFLLNVFLLKDASTSSGFMPALRHLAIADEAFR